MKRIETSKDRATAPEPWWKEVRSGNAPSAPSPHSFKTRVEGIGYPELAVETPGS